MRAAPRRDRRHCHQCERCFRARGLSENVADRGAAMLKLIDVIAKEGDRPVTLDELKKHVNAADFTDDDAQLEIFLDAAIDFVAGRTSLTLRRSSWRIDRCDWWSGCLQVLLAPVRDITITYLDPTGA